MGVSPIRLSNREIDQDFPNSDPRVWYFVSSGESTNLNRKGCREDEIRHTTINRRNSDRGDVRDWLRLGGTYFNPSAAYRDCNLRTYSDADAD